MPEYLHDHKEFASLINILANENLKKQIKTSNIKLNAGEKRKRYIIVETGTLNCEGREEGRNGK